MKTGHIFVISALVISSTFFGILSLYNLPESVTEWVISDIILGAVLYGVVRKLSGNCDGNRLIQN